MPIALDNPIINDPFEEPMNYWEYREGQPYLKEGRRPAGYYFRPRTRPEMGAVAEEDFIELTTVNEIRKRINEWRSSGYQGATRITRELLEHWNSSERERRLFFCQKEAVETIIWLHEAPAYLRQGIEIPFDEPIDPISLKKNYKGLQRYACKMATGSGKTVVMAMLISWSVINKVANPKDIRFSDAILIVCPNLTIKERLQVLKPSHLKNYYDYFELVPSSLRSHLEKGKFLITNWHLFLPEDDTGKHSVVQRGEESDKAFGNRVLRDLGTKENILVINDESHHAYRPAIRETEKQVLFKELTSDQSNKLQEEELEATIWVGGLDKVNAIRKINFCLDLSATPFYLKGVGYEEGKPFPWTVSDFGLVDAIECGIVKIPRVPVDDNTGLPEPKYFRLWERIMQALPLSERASGKRKAKPESVYREAEDALITLASEWKKKVNEFKEQNYPFPPALIIVCDNTKLAEYVAENIINGQAISEFKNLPNKEVTMRIDTRLLEKAESVVEGMTREKAADYLRKKLATVGKTEWEGEGTPPGKDIRCVVSVGMINEGWDAQNVTQILGLRAFTSQLLCEQVVGRGLRRTQYDDFTVAEYCDVYGVPFEVIPVKKSSKKRPEPPKPLTLIKALPERKELEIRFPRVEGYVFDVRYRIKADIDSIPKMTIDPSKAPTEVKVKDAVGYKIGRPDRLGPGKEVTHDRNPFYKDKRLQATVYEIASQITKNLKPNSFDPESRQYIFPQVLNIVWLFLNQRVNFVDAPPQEVALRRYLDLIVERLSSIIEPDTESGEHPLLPILERFRRVGSTAEVLFRTSRICHATIKSHISHVVTDTMQWEHAVGYQLESIQEVVSYARNDHLGFTIQYEYQGHTHPYTPDFLIRLKKKDSSNIMLILEVKGFESEQDRQKETGAMRWISAVNYYKEFGKWAYLICRNPWKLKQEINKLL
ncbi:MAG: DEAD/DEAH box helicase family protein [Candidatus Latescibacteria bacterium]|nr:DEAD/DEAH box helicase family protein [Candidatus Latescibacterota bacterium]